MCRAVALHLFINFNGGETEKKGKPVMIRFHGVSIIYLHDIISAMEKFRPLPLRKIALKVYFMVVLSEK